MFWTFSCFQGILVILWVSLSSDFRVFFFFQKKIILPVRITKISKILKNNQNAPRTTSTTPKTFQMTNTPLNPEISKIPLKPLKMTKIHLN